MVFERCVSFFLVRSYTYNPQVKVELPKSDDEDDGPICPNTKFPIQCVAADVYYNSLYLIFLGGKKRLRVFICRPITRFMY